MATQLTIWLGSDTLLKLEEFKDEITDAYIVAATVTAVIKDEADATLGATITFTDQGSGLYTGIVKDDHASLVDGSRVFVELTADGGADLKLFIRDYAFVKRRGAER